jgi:hypothetical protein
MIGRVTGVPLYFTFLGFFISKISTSIGC